MADKRIRLVIVTLSAALLLVVGVLVAAPRLAEVGEGPAATQSEMAAPTAPADAPPAARPVGVPMPFEKRSGQLPKDMPIEIPVLDGEVSRAVSATKPGGKGPWLYDLETTQSPAAVAAWYRQAYGQRNWALERDETGGSDGDVEYVLGFRKGAGAESVLRVVPIASGSRVEVSVGLGTDVEQTY